MAFNEEWNVPNSDDERDEAFISCTTNGETTDDIPLQVLEYYEQIEQNKVLELKVQEFRKLIPVANDKTESEDSCVENTDGNDQEGEGGKCKEAIVVDEEEKKDKRSNEPSEFDEFDELEGCQGQLPKRTPKSGRLPKKRVGTLKNVISNLKRFREMDVSTSEGNDTKNTSSDEGKQEENNTSEKDKPTEAGST